MKLASNILILALALALGAGAQQPVSVEQVKPDCNLFFTVNPPYVPPYVHGGVGLDDLTIDGRYTGIITSTYLVTLTFAGAVDQFTWNETGGGFGAAIPMTGGWQTLNNGVQIRFTATTGHALGNTWTFTYTLPLPAQEWNSGTIDNRRGGCRYWSLSYAATTAIAAVNLEMESAPDASGAPGTWVIFPGVAMTGTNPLVTVPSGVATFTGYQPWLRVHVNSGDNAAIINGRLFGWRDQGITPVALVGVVGTPVFCPFSAVLTVAGPATTQILGLAAGQSIRVCHISMSLTGPSAVTLIESAKAACAAPVAVSGTYANITAMALDFGMSPLTLTASTALCVNVAAAVNAGGLVSYAIF